MPFFGRKKKNKNLSLDLLNEISLPEKPKDREPDEESRLNKELDSLDIGPNDDCYEILKQLSLNTIDAFLASISVSSKGDKTKYIKAYLVPLAEVLQGANTTTGLSSNVMSCISCINRTEIMGMSARVVMRRERWNTSGYQMVKLLESCKKILDADVIRDIKSITEYDSYPAGTSVRRYSKRYFGEGVEYALRPAIEILGDNLTKAHFKVLKEIIDTGFKTKLNSFRSENAKVFTGDVELEFYEIFTEGIIPTLSKLKGKVSADELGEIGKAIIKISVAADAIHLSFYDVLKEFQKNITKTDSNIKVSDIEQIGIKAIKNVSISKGK